MYTTLGIKVKDDKNGQKVRNKTTGQSHISSIAKPPILQRQLYLWLVMMGLALLLLLIDTRIGMSLVWGFSVCLLPAICFTWYATKYQGARAALGVVNGFYRAETVKFILTAILFALVFQRVEQIYPSAFFLAFVAAQIFSWVLIAYSLRQPPR